MNNGVPVAACGLPGVRQPVTMTGMGEVSGIGDHLALAQSINNILDNKASYLKDAQLIQQSFSPAQTANEYMKLFRNLQQNLHETRALEPDAYDRLRAMRDGLSRD